MLTSRRCATSSQNGSGCCPTCAHSLRTHRCPRRHPRRRPRRRPRRLHPRRRRRGHPTPGTAGEDMAFTVSRSTPLAPEVAWLAVADRMLVTVLEPGRRLRLVKVGRLLRGWADITVRTDPDRPDGALVDWTEELWLPGLRGPTRRLGDRAGPIVFGRVVDAVLARAADDDQDAVRPTRSGSAP